MSSYLDEGRTGPLHLTCEKCVPHESAESLIMSPSSRTEENDGCYEKDRYEQDG